MRAGSGTTVADTSYRSSLYWPGWFKAAPPSGLIAFINTTKFVKNFTMFLAISGAISLIDPVNGLQSF
jgi:hypothetical protein